MRIGIDEVATMSDAAVGLCNEESVCPSGSRAQGLSGCDPLTHNCVCQLGYQLDSGVCVGKLPVLTMLIRVDKRNWTIESDKSNKT